MCLSAKTLQLPHSRQARGGAGASLREDRPRVPVRGEAGPRQRRRRALPRRPLRHDHLRAAAEVREEEEVNRGGDHEVNL